MTPDDRNPPSLGYDAIPNGAWRGPHQSPPSGRPLYLKTSEDPIDWRKSTALGLAILIALAACAAVFAFIFIEVGRRVEREANKAAAVERVPR